MFLPPNPATMYHILLMRHAQSEGNARGVLQGQSDFPLSDKGQRQAKAAARRFRSEQLAFNGIIASPLQRAHQTAHIIAASLVLPVEVDADWMERNNGNLAGLRPDEIAARYPKAGFVQLYEPVGEVGESQWELFLRAGRALQRLIGTHAPGRYLVVSHGGILNLALYAILGISPQGNLNGPRFRFQNTAFASLTYNPERHTWSVESLNDRAHWSKNES